MAQPEHLLSQVLQLHLALVALLRHALDVGLPRSDHRLATLRLRHRLAQAIHARLVLAHACAQLDDDVLVRVRVRVRVEVRVRVRVRVRVGVRVRVRIRVRVRVRVRVGARR